MKLLVQYVLIHCVLTGFCVYGKITLKCEDQTGAQGNVTLRCTASYPEVSSPCHFVQYKWKNISTEIFTFHCKNASAQNKPGYDCNSIVTKFTDTLPNLTEGIYHLWVQAECDQGTSDRFRVNITALKPPHEHSENKDHGDEKSDGRGNALEIRSINGTDKDCTNKKCDGSEKNNPNHSNIIGGVVGAVILCTIIIALGFFMVKRCNNHRQHMRWSCFSANHNRQTCSLLTEQT